MKVRGWSESVWTPMRFFGWLHIMQKAFEKLMQPEKNKICRKEKKPKKSNNLDRQHVVKYPRTRIYPRNSPKRRTTYAPTRRSVYFMTFCCIQNEYRSVTRVLDKVKKSIFLNKRILNKRRIKEWKKIIPCFEFPFFAIGNFTSYTIQ